MGTIICEGEPPFELVTQQLPTASSEGDIVVLTLAVFAAGFPANTADIQVRLTIEHAEQLAAQLQPAMKMANVRRGR